MFLTVFVGAFFFVALIVWVFFEFYSLDGGGKPAYDAEKYRCSQLLQGGRNGDVPDDSASEPRIVVLVAKTPTTKLAARIVLGFAAALVGLWIWGFVDAADLEYTARMNTDSEKAGAVLAGLAHGVRRDPKTRTKKNLRNAADGGTPGKTRINTVNTAAVEPPSPGALHRARGWSITLKILSWRRKARSSVSSCSCVNGASGKCFR